MTAIVLPGRYQKAHSICESKHGNKEIDGGPISLAFHRQLALPASRKQTTDRASHCMPRLVYQQHG